MSDFVIPSAAPGWYNDPQRMGTLRYFDGASWTEHVAPAPVAATTTVVGPGSYGEQPDLRPPAVGDHPSDPMHWVLPTGRTWQSIAAGYAGLCSILVFPGPIALGLGIWALMESRKTGAHGRGRAIFVGTPTTILTTLIVGQALF